MEILSTLPFMASCGGLLRRNLMQMLVLHYTFNSCKENIRQDKSEVKSKNSKKENSVNREINFYFLLLT